MGTHLWWMGLAALGLCACDSKVRPDTGEPPADTEDTAVLGDPVACGALPPSDSLPQTVEFRTSEQSFNTRWQVALVEGLIHVKPLEGEGEWELLGDGLPDGSLGNWGRPSSIVELSSDGVHLTALSDAGAFYRGTDMTTDIQAGFTWEDGWGGLLADGPGITTQFSTDCGWSVSDSHPFGVAWYQDPNGTQHSVGLGVAHVYRLGPDGRSLHFNDWWLAPDWSRQICGPERGTFRAVNLSVSASTLFLVGERGELYTRLYDYDTGGENHLLTYSYIVGPDSGTTRKLPAEDWRRQPDPPGRITPRITIAQDGEGNAARVLRVEGEEDGVGGYYTKHIYDDAWTFQATGNTVSGPFLDEAEASEPVEPEDFPMEGTLSVDGHTVGIQVQDINMVCSPARALLTWGSQVVTADGAPLELELHHVNTWVEETRPVRFWEQGIPARVQAALLVPQDLDRIDDPQAREEVQALFGTRLVVDLLGDMTPQEAVLDEIMWTEPFRVPAEEKAFWSGIRLELVGSR